MLKRTTILMAIILLELFTVVPSFADNRTSKQTNKVVFITGASSGIGEALAYEFHQRGYIVHISARRFDRLQKIADELNSIRTSSVFPHKVDVRIYEDLVRAREEMELMDHKADLVIANAGIAMPGTADQLSLDDYKAVFETNTWGVVGTYKAFAEHLKETKGSFGVMGSVLSYTSGFSGSAYGMSKFALRAFSDSLRAELHPFNVSVSFFAPGYVDTEIRKSKDNVLLPEWMILKPDHVARIVATGMEKRKEVVVISTHAKAIIGVDRYFPKLSRKLKNRINK